MTRAMTTLLGAGVAALALILAAGGTDARAAELIGGRIKVSTDSAEGDVTQIALAPGFQGKLLAVYGRSRGKCCYVDVLYAQSLGKQARPTGKPVRYDVELASGRTSDLILGGAARLNDGQFFAPWSGRNHHAPYQSLAAIVRDGDLRKTKTLSDGSKDAIADAPIPLADGGAVQLWRSGEAGVARVGRFVGADGKLGDEIRIEDAPEASGQVYVTPIATGYLVSFVNANTSAVFFKVTGRTFDASFAPTSDFFELQATTTRPENPSFSIVAIAGGRAVQVRLVKPARTKFKVLADVIDESGAISRTVEIAKGTTDAFKVNAVPLDDGGFALEVVSRNEIPRLYKIMRFDKTLQKVGAAAEFKAYGIYSHGLPTPVVSRDGVLAVPFVESGEGYVQLVKF